MQVLAELTVPRDAKFVATLRRVLGGVMAVEEAPAETVHELKIALSEACANVILHADGPQYRVEVHLGEHECAVKVSDTGPGFHPEPEDLEPSQLGAEEGRGLALISELVEDLDFSCDDDGMEVCFSKSW